jgi:hypothetical protein
MQVNWSCARMLPYWTFAHPATCRRFLYLTMATALAAARVGGKRGRAAQPPAGTRVWVGDAPSTSLVESLLCPICIGVFREARGPNSSAARTGR